MSQIKVLVASSQPVLREGIRVTLADTPYQVWFEADDRRVAVNAATSGSPQVCLIDVDLRDGGLAAAREMSQRAPQSCVIVLADECTEANLLEAVRVGAVGFLGKDSGALALPRAIAAVLEGEAAIPRRLVARLLVAVKSGGVETRSDGRFAGLTQREAEVLEMVRAGRSTNNIAASLFVAPVTVRTHVSSIVHKLRVPDRRALVEAVNGTV